MTSSDFEAVTDAAIEERILSLLATRQDGATICPSEVARSLVPGAEWRRLMPHVRQVAQSLAQSNRLSVTRGGVQVEATSGGGPIRLGRPIERDDTPQA